MEFFCKSLVLNVLMPKVGLASFSMKLYGFVVVITSSLLRGNKFFVSLHAPSTKKKESISIMTKKEALQLFEQRKVRTIWDDQEEKWYFSIVDVCGVLADSKDSLTARKYWNKLKQRLKDEGNETVTKCHQLKLRAADGKLRLTDVADTEQLFRIIQSIPSPKAEPFKQWMARVARQRLDQLQDPELSIDQAVETHGRTRRFGICFAYRHHHS